MRHAKQRPLVCIFKLQMNILNALKFNIKLLKFEKIKYAMLCR